MKTFKYDNIFNYNNGKYYDYIDHHGEAKEKLKTHIMDTIEIMLKEIPNWFIEFSDVWFKDLNKSRYYTSTEGLGKQSILEQSTQLIESMCHSQTSRRISVKQIARWNGMMDDLKKIMEKHYPEEAIIWTNQQIEMIEHSRKTGNNLDNLIEK
tara:strand:- start:274 stop:732 length:459 start_codon:yes stop_codon:yes gene_type:complete